MKINLFIAFRYIQGKGKKVYFSFFTIVSILGIILGIAALIATVGVMNGFQSDIKQKIISLQSFHINIVDYFNSPIKDYKKLIDKIEKIKHVKFAFGYIETPALFSSENNLKGTVVRGYDNNFYNSDLFKKNIKIFNNITNNENTDNKNLKVSNDKSKSDNKNSKDLQSKIFIKDNEVLIGKEFALIYGFEKGSTFPIASASKSIFSPTMKFVKVKALFKTGYYPIDSQIIYASLSLTQKLLNLDNACSSIGVVVDDLKNLESVKKKIDQILPFRLYTKAWYDYNKNFFEALKNEKTMLFFIVFLIVIVASFNMVSSQIMLVMSKQKEIGILKALGFTPFDIKAIFILYGSIIGLIGSFMGVILGLLILKNIDWIFNSVEKLVNSIINFIFGIISIFNQNVIVPHFQIFSKDVYYFDKIPVKIYFNEIFVIVLFSMIIVFLASFIPANKAGKVSPKDVIHNE